MRPADYHALLGYLNAPPATRAIPTVLVRGEKPTEDEAHPAPAEIIDLPARVACLSNELLINAAWSALTYSYGVLNGPPPDAHHLIGQLKDLEVWSARRQRSTDEIRGTALGVVILLSVVCREAGCPAPDFLRHWWGIVRSRFAFCDTQDVALDSPPASNLERVGKERRKWREVVFNGQRDERAACRLPATIRRPASSLP